MGLYLRTRFAPRPWPVPFDEILRQWISAELEPGKCRVAIERALAGGMPEGLLDPTQLEHGGPIATDALLYGNRIDEPWVWSASSPAGIVGFEVSPALVPTLAELVRIAARSDSRRDAIEQAGEYLSADTIEIFAAALEDGEAHGKWIAPDRPGVYRREHASLVLRARSGMTLVIDPQRLNHTWTTNFGKYPADPAFDTARVLITHSHEDHFDLASIVGSTVADGDVIVPRVPRASLLSDDMSALVAHAEQTVRAPGWGERLVLDGVVVHVLPFYGEQPTRALPLPDMVRNWGNCYRFDFDEWSLAILADGGEDAAGSCVDVLRTSAREHGPIDVVMSCCASFPEMINLGLPHYAFVVEFDALRRHYGSRGFITSGPSGVAAACEAAGARYLLPYAHGFRGVFTDPMSPESNVLERSLIDGVRGELSRRGCGTEVLEWLPGDALFWEAGRPVVDRARTA